MFDFDGVLADSEPLHLRVYQEILEPHGIHLDEATYRAKYLGFDDEGAFQQIAADNNLLLGDEEIELLITQKSRRFQQHRFERRRPYPAAASCVRRLGGGVADRDRVGRAARRDRADAARRGTPRCVPLHRLCR